MPYVRESVAYDDYDGNTHWVDDPEDTWFQGPDREPPLDDVYGILTHVWDPENPEDQAYWWDYVGEAMDEWEYWDDYLAVMADEHGYSLA